MDALLGFDLVPITVTREINGRPGVIQLAFRNFVTESKRRRQGLVASDWCPLPAQQQLLTVFDFLIGQEDRSTANYGYTQPQWDLHASYHGEAFTTLHELPASAKDLGQGLPTNVWIALRELNEQNLEEAVGQQISNAQITALLARRDAILSITGGPAASYDLPGMAARNDRHP